MYYLALAGLVFGVNLLPAFGPPTWALLVFARLQWHLNPVALVAIGIVSAGTGRAVLAVAARRFRRFFPTKYLNNLEAAEQRLTSNATRTYVLLGLFLLSPLPSAQLFCAAGLLELNLPPLVVAFMAGRAVSYSLYVATATAIQTQLGSIMGDVWSSPWSITIQILFLVLLAVLPLIDWRRRPNRQEPSSTSS